MAHTEFDFAGHRRNLVALGRALAAQGCARTSSSATIYRQQFADRVIIIEDEPGLDVHTASMR